jgi:electron transfer flavoprotein-quinone oxidoreductase
MLIIGFILPGIIHRRAGLSLVFHRRTLKLPAGTGNECPGLMTASKYDVVIVGAGPAGITAAIALAKADIPVLVIEAGVFPGAENWSGAVYFTEQLAQPDVLGEQAVRDSAYERPVTKRGFYIYNGHSLAGLGYRNPATFANCYTVLRPTYDHYLAELAKSFGATILTETTADGLLRDEHNRIIGVHTDRGPIYADVVFLAEGDASHLVSKEGYERAKDPNAPHFLQGIKEVIEVEPEQIERQFGLPRGEGAAFEILLRNGSLHNRQARLNAGGFIYTNRASVSLGLVMPLDNLAREFGGDHNRLMEWFKSLPEIRRWAGSARSIAYGTKIIRGGGFRELPQLVDDGLAIGGAATGIGLDFPYPNFTGPATAMGRLFANAVKEIRATDKSFSRIRLEELYEQPLRQTHYFRNVEFLENWPHYIEHTRVFFGRFVDLKTGALYVAGNPSLRAPQKLWQLAKFVRETLPLKHWGEFIRDLREQRNALGLKRLKHAPRSTLHAPDGTVSVEFSVDGQRQEEFLWPLSRLMRKLPRVLGPACDHVYRNDDTPLPAKLRNAIAAARKGIGIFDAMLLAGFSLLILALTPIQWLCEMIKLIITRPSPEQFLSSFFQKYRALVRKRTNLDPDTVKIEQPWEEKLSLIRYFSEEHSHIKVFRPEHFENRAKIAESPLWHICPAKVYECHTDDLGQSQLIVNFENCIKCETCWRGAPHDVDWTRQRTHRLIFQAYTEANRKLLELMKRNGHTPRLLPVAQTTEILRFAQNDKSKKLAAKLREFCDTVYAEPRYFDTARTKWLLGLLEQAQSLAGTIGDPAIDRQLARVITHAKRRKFFWAEADARQLLTTETTEILLPQLRDQNDNRQELRSELDKLFPKQAIKDLEHEKRLTDEQLKFLKSLVKAKSPPRAVILQELARKDSSFAVLVSGIYPAQIAARPELANIPWIGLTAARTHWKDFRTKKAPDLPQVAADMCAIVLGAGEMLLERCKQHAISRVQFPGLFKDEDGRDGIAKFGAVKRLLSEMEAQVYLLRALSGHAESHPAEVKILAAEAFGPDEGSLTYNAGQIIGGSAYSEDDIFSKFYRDSVCFSYLLYDDNELRRQIGEDADARLRQFALEVVRKQAGENPTELEAEIVKIFARFVNLSEARNDKLCELGERILATGYPEQPLKNPPAFTYRDALKTGQPYDYGDYLVRPFDPNAWRFTPEMLFADAELRAYHEKLYEHFTERYWNKRFDGLPYYRLVEKQHMVPLEDVRDMIARGFTRMYIPKEFGGEGLLKAHYYILCPLSMRYVDPSYALTIMAHSSIGTTPVLLGLNQDLPRARKDLQEFLCDQSKIQDLKSDIANILRMLDSPEAVRVKPAFMQLGETVRAGLGRKPMLRAVAAGFLRHFMDAGRAGLRMDLAGFRSELAAAGDALQQIVPRAETLIAELDRRAQAHRLFLKFISAGQISAFALTEPSAGSDSGGIQTRATLKKVEVLTDSDGARYFLLDGERRNILDAATVDVTKIEYSGYDYAKSTGIRKYEGREFHDIAQIRREGDREFYEYYELNGAKMWITNAHVAGVFCLYARTPEGPTGFMVDRHAEGLVVGKDEEKMGQRGSPTNEMGLTGVRVPRENIIGIEGRGQVNALESLNVGRTGLCVSAAAMTAKIIGQTRDFVRQRGLERDPRVVELLGRMALEQYANESLAYELVGRFDHHDTQSVRTESAIGKCYASELLHRVIRAAERIHGIEGCTQLHELEKHRRDARVLNIYEGTNEVQRFLILRDLVDHVLPRAGHDDSAATGEAAAEPAGLADARQALWRALRRAVDAFGPQVWQNANFQPTMFKLADIAGYIKLMDSALWRAAWLRAHLKEEDNVHAELAQAACDQFVAHATAQIHRLHEEFQRELSLLKQGLYPPEVRAAFLSLQAAEGRKPKPPRQPPAHNVTRPMRVVVVLDIEPVLSPRPRVVCGSLWETHFRFDAASRAALARALEVRSAGRDTTVSVVTVAPRYAADLLRQALATGADDAVLLQTDDLPDDLHAAARLIADPIAMDCDAGRPCDLVLCATQILAAVLAGNLGLPHLSDVAEFLVSGDRLEVTLQQPAATLARSAPIVLAIAAAQAPADFSIADLLAAQGKPLRVLDARQIDAGHGFETRLRLPETAPVAEHIEATPEAAAELALALAGARGEAGAAAAKPFAGIVELAGREKLPVRDAAVFVATDGNLDGLPAAADGAEKLMLPFHALVFGDLDEPAMRRIAARAPAESVWFVTNPQLAGGPPGGVLAAMQSVWKDTLPNAVMAGVWANEILAQFAKTFPRVQARYNVVEVLRRNGDVELVAPVYGGKLQRAARLVHLAGHPLVMTLAPAATGKNTSRPATDDAPRRVCHVPLDFEYDRASDDLARLLRAGPDEAAPTTIAGAEVIIDVGYAIRNRENFERIVVPLKKRLEDCGVKQVMIGGTRKVVEELKLLGPDQQIGQTGAGVDPRLIIAIGVSGAPQHLDYIGERATIIAFNKDPEAPLMTLNKRKPRPRIVPIVGDLYELVPRFTQSLKR